ncbi:MULTISPECIES: hypothetical protein [unclassified Streptomyces]|uniref:hypothetical protein n=1 Tax=unclassified Streptomyces TaxID=2593676 RepID=UPI00224DA412|nr:MULTISPECIES: hypothetical protein [unclassified Streptomyces]MCX5048868.1 hypothetical protein [Streptomyces sp. NBC_00474]
MKIARRRTTAAVLSAAVLALGAAAVHVGTEGRTVQAAHARIDWPLHGAHDVRVQSATAAVANPIDWP